MRIAHYMTRILEHGGVATYIRRITDAQVAAGHVVYWLDKYPLTSSTEDNFNLAGKLLIVKDDVALFEHLENNHFDILHLHIEIGLNPPRELPIIRHIHNHNSYCPSGSRFLQRWKKPCDRSYSLGGCLRGHLIDRCGSVRPQNLWAGFERVWQEMENLPHIHTIANSGFVRDQMLRSGYPSNKLHPLYYPAPEERAYTLPQQDVIPHFLFLGRLVPEKGWEWLLRSLALVKIPVRLDIAGTGNDQQNWAIRLLAEQLGVIDRVTFHGWVDQQKSFELLQKALALIFPSVWHEPAGIVSLEAAVAGRCIIASNVGGIPEYTKLLRNAILVEPNDEMGLARIMEKLAKDVTLAQDLGLEGRKRAKEVFSVEEHLQQLMNLYSLAINTQN